MLRDAATFAATEDHSFTVCIIGAGAAGITLALKLARSGVKIVLLEGGGLEMTDQSQDLYMGDADGYVDLDIARLRYFGGTTNHWTGYCRNPKPVDLEARPWLPQTGWPIGFETIEPYLEEAAASVEVGTQYDVAFWTDELQTAPLSIETTDLDQDVSLVGPPVRFAQKFRADIEAAPEITCLTGANVVEIELNEGANRTDAVRVRRYDGEEFRILADYVVLACGGIENARLLLNSDSRIPDGVGNSSGNVGRFFADHAIVSAGQASILSTASGIFSRSVWPTRHSHTLVPHLVATAEAAEKAEIGRCVLRLTQRRRDRGNVFGRVFDQVTDYLSFGIGTEYEEYDLLAFAEPIPDAENRVVLSDEHDALGLRRVKVRYRPHELEMKAVDHVVGLFGTALGAENTGRVQIDMAPFEDRFFEWGYHHYGTTRMSDDPAAGVVDADLKVHGVDNLYIAGTSAFPNGGIMTPTMTLVALTLRLGDELDRRIAS